MMKTPGAVDFETEAIGPRPAYPPRPVGVALRSPRWKKGKYYAFGHRGADGSTAGMGNNCTEADAKRALLEFLESHTPICHHAGFDLDVAETHWGIAWPERHEDTLLLGFLVDPDSRSLSLKPQAERWLGEPPTERDEMNDWIVANVDGATRKTAGAFICRAPVRLAGPYAIGDVDRTVALFRRFSAELDVEPRLRTAYERELKVTRSLIRMERRGIPMRVADLERDVVEYADVLRAIELELLARLKVPEKLRGDILDYYDEQDTFKWSGPGFAEWLLRSKLVKSLPLTEKGNPSTSAESLALVMPKEMAHEFEVRSQVATCLNTFMRPWLAQARETDGLFFARFNQVRNGDEWGKKTGARTGRLSMTPNLQNVIRSDKDDRVPKLRRYVGDAKRKRWKRVIELDYSQQELRLLAHFEDGPFKSAYMANPRQDAHLLVAELILRTTGVKLERRPVKDLNFGILYGQGVNLTAEKLKVSKDEAKRLQKAHGEALPGVPDLQKLLKARAQNKEPIFTWGGRRYYCEPPKVVKGRLWTFDYKLLNVLIQGSAADVTKQAMVNYDAMGAIADENPMLLQVHDSLLLGVAGSDPAAARAVYEAADAAMRDIGGVEIPMLTDAKASTRSWGDMKPVPKSWVTT